MSANTKVAATFHGAELPIGTPVTYWPGVREGDGIESVTRSNVWPVCGQPVVLVDGYAGGIALTHVERRKEQPDLTPEQDLRAAITDMLANADHFGQCGDMAALAADVGVHRDMNDCVCLIGRLNWAINAEEVRTETDPTEDAIAVIARTISSHVLDDSLSIADLWEDYAEIGESDWDAVVAAVTSRAKTAKPDDDTFNAAYAHLKTRSQAWSDEHDGAA